MSRSDASGGFIEVLQSGPFVQLQDLGRHSYFSLGLTRAGAADEKAYCWANKLLGNAMGAPALEITMGPFACVFSATVSFSICGADMEATLDGKPVPTGSSALSAAGSVLEMKVPRSGLHAYFAVASGWLGHPQLGSVSAPRNEEAVWQHKTGTMPRKGARLYWKMHHPAESAACLVKRVPWEFFTPVPVEDEIVLPYIPNCNRALVTEEISTRFEQQSWRIGADFNRMGYRLHGKALEGLTGKLPSHGICRGMVQLPPNGQPIVLLNDHQTMGGYPLLGCVTHAGCDRLNQCRTGGVVRFSPQSIDVARKKRREFLNFFRRNF